MKRHSLTSTVSARLYCRGDRHECVGGKRLFSWKAAAPLRPQDLFAKQPSQRDFVEPSVPRFFFHLYDDMITADEEGQELVGTLAARERAIAIAREMVCSEVLGGHLNLKHRIEVADESGKIIATVRFKDAVELES